MVLLNRSSTGLLDHNRVKSYKHFRDNGYTNLVAARKARAIRDKKQTDKAVALVKEYGEKNGSLTPAKLLEKRKAQDEADLANVAKRHRPTQPWSCLATSSTCNGSPKRAEDISRLDGYCLFCRNHCAVP